jgi:short-subunit dehydrogenase
MSRDVRGEAASRAIVVGASSGLGEALARELARRGASVALVARRAERLAELAKALEDAHGTGRARAYVHDVRRVADVAPLFERIAAELHGVDVVVYAAGVMPAVGPEEYDSSKDRDIVETNLLGAMAWLGEAARWFTVARAGTIVGISSTAGERGRRNAPAYGASKAGLNCYLESLRNRLGRYGVRVLTVKPGFVRTSMLDGRKGLFWVAEPALAARQICDALGGRAQTIFVTRRWRLVSWALRALPSFVFRRIPF